MRLFSGTLTADERAAIAHLFAETPIPVAVLRGQDRVFDVANPAYLDVVRGPDIVGKPILDALPELKGQGIDEVLRGVMKTDAPHVGREFLLKLERDGRLEDVIEDDESSRRALVNVLEDRGYSVMAVDGGDAALAYLRESAAPNLIVLDLMMHEMDGWNGTSYFLVKK